jgi:glycosyltransferase involved in cell wall biosynthesis
MSEAQKAHYERLFPFLRERHSTVLSSVFDEQTFAAIHLLQEKNADSKRSGWIVLGSPSWVKGQDAAMQWCHDNGHVPDVVWGLDYAELLKRLATAEGFVYLPAGRDTCPRMVIEAKLLGCKLVLNDNVQHANEEWFITDDILTTESYLYMARSRFWNGITANMGEDDSSISGYTTTYNCIENDYPFRECIESMLGFCDEVVIVDAGSTDGTWEELTHLASLHENVIIHKQMRDRSKRRWAIDFDGRQKALARSLCTRAFCWQQDSDEVVHEDDYMKIKHLTKHFPKNAALLCLPVIEYWGSQGKTRCDIHNWKWRLSRNLPDITHGIPAQFRRFDDDGQLYAARGSDSCDYISLSTYQPIPCMNFYTADIDAARRRAVVDSDADMLDEYAAWYNQIVAALPSVHHYSWFNVGRKVRSYRNYWGGFWYSMYNEQRADTAANNMFIDKPWSLVTDDEIETLAKRLEDELGGWVFHTKVNWNVSVPHIECARSHPALMPEWIARNARNRRS